MKRIVNAISLVAIVASLGALFWLNRPADEGRQTRDTEFAVNANRVVHFHPNPEIMDGLNEVDLEDQLRDWLLYAVMGESGLDSEALRKALYDVPPSRAEYIKPVASFEFGEARFRVIDGSGTTVALIPANSPQRRDLLAQIADAVRISIGSKPGALRVFEYSIDPVELTATVTRTPDVPGTSLFSDAYGYAEAEVHDASQLADLMGRMDDVTSASPAGSGIRITGRRVEGSKAHKLRVEDIAALWQSEKQLANDRVRIDAFNARWQSEDTIRSIVEPKYQRELNAILAKYPEPSKARPPLWRISPSLPNETGLDGIPSGMSPGTAEALRKDFPSLFKRSYGSKGGVVPLLRPRKKDPLLSFENDSDAEAPAADPDAGSREEALAKLKEKWSDESYLKSLIQPQHDRELAELKKRLSSKGSAGIPDGSGFSLDPSFDYVKLEKVFETLHPLLQAIGKPEELADAERSIQEGKEGPFLDLLYRAQQGKSGLSALIGPVSEQMIQRAQFQHARYDGSLSGTEAGMVLFYTDLLAKLWALDYLERAPAEQVRGFVPLLKVAVSPIYEQEIRDLSGTRLWFGARDSAYSKTPGELLFARIATRVYAASSNTLQPGKEAEPNAASADFLGWWNDHYAQVAQFEPEYQRLNEIMKWSVIVGWLSATDHIDNLDYLVGVPVKRDNWFPDWARKNQALKFRDWDRMEFYERGYKGVETESMPILYSRPYGVPSGMHSLSGGVSLGSRREIMSRPDLKVEIETLARRPNVEEIPGSVKGSAFKSSENTVFKFRPVEKETPAAFEVNAKPAAKLRGPDIELKNAAFEVGFDERKSGLRVTVATDHHAIGELSIERRAGGRDIDVLFAPRDVEYCRAYSKTISEATARGENPLAAMAARPDVRTVIEHDGSYYVEPLGNRSSWIKISPEGDPSANISNQADLRFGKLGTGVKQPMSRWNIAFVDRQRVDTEISKTGKYIVHPPEASTRRGVAFSIMNKGPPTGESVPPDGHSMLAAIDKARGGNGPGNGGGDEGFRFASFSGNDGPRNLAREAALDPEGTLALLARQRKTALEHSDSLIRSGDFEQARIELDDLSAVFPDNPDVLMRRVIAYAGSDSQTTGAEAARLRIAPAQIPEFLDAADAALPKLAMGSKARAKLSAVVRGTVAKAQGKDVHYLYFGQKAELGVEIRLSDFRLESVSADEVVPGGARYTLENLDTNPTGFSMPMPPPSEPITAKLRDDTIALVQPEVIVDSRTHRRYWRFSDPDTQTAPSFRGRYDASRNNCSDMPEEERRKHQECQKDVYLAGRDQDKIASR
jgi:hypothetical protein